MDETLELLLAGILTFSFGWNNSGILIGNERGSGTLSAKESTILCSIGMILGVALEGAKMKGSLGGMIVGQATSALVIDTLVVSILLTVALTLVAIPVSFSNTMVGAFVGAGFASSFVIEGARVESVLVFWALAPIATMGVTFLVYRAIQRLTANMSLLAVDQLNRGGVGLVSLALAYVLSANNIGLIYGTAFATASASGNPIPVVLVLALCAILGMALLGRGAVAGTVGDRLVSLAPQGVLAAFVGTILMMWLATQLSIPISASQCLLGGMFGAAFTKRVSIVNRRLSAEVLTSWVLVPLASFALAALLVAL